VLGRRALAQAARRATGSRFRRADRLPSRRTRRTIRPRARRAAACGVVVPGALRRARRAWPHVPLPVTRAASTRWRAWPLAGNGLLPSPGLSSPASLRSARAPRTPPGRCRALHITRALCATGARGARTNSPRAGASRRSEGGRRGFDERRKNSRARLQRGRCRRVTLRASLPRAASAVLLRARPRSRTRARPAPRRTRGARLRRAAAGRARCPARAPSLARACPRAWVEDQSPAEDRRRTRAEKARAMTGLQAARATRAHCTPPAGLHSAPVM